MQDPWAHDAFGDPNASKPPAAPGPSRTHPPRVGRISWDRFLESLHWVVGALLVGAIAMWVLLWSRNYRRSTEDAERMERERATFKDAVQDLERERLAHTEAVKKLTKANSALQGQVDSLKRQAIGQVPPATGEETDTGRIHQAVARAHRQKRDEEVARCIAQRHATSDWPWYGGDISGEVREELLRWGADPTQCDVQSIIERAYDLAGKDKTRRRLK